MDTRKKGGYKYSQSEKEALRVLKMQEQDLESLGNDTSSQTDELGELRKRVEKLSATLGVASKPKAEDAEVPRTTLNIPVSDIPSWESLVERAGNEVPADVAFENLLSGEEFDYCIEDVGRINDVFMSRTNLTKSDMSFLAVATALQTLRWILCNQLFGDAGATFSTDDVLKRLDRKIKDGVSGRNIDLANLGSKKRPVGHKPWENIIFDSAPYDVTAGLPGTDTDGSPRHKAFGHHPVLGWLFGTANLITDTVTLSNFSSYRIERNPYPRLGAHTSLPKILRETVDSTKEDWLRLPAGIFAQYRNMRADELARYGLPAPSADAFSEDFAGDLYKSQYESLCLLRELKIDEKRAAVSIFINMVVGLVHGLSYDPARDGERKFFEARTRKILLLSNSLASAGNLAFCTVTENLGKLDLGGLIVTAGRLFSDVRFITRLKEEFIEKEIDKSIREELASIDANFIRPEQ